jgi:hypothetical protein
MKRNLLFKPTLAAAMIMTLGFESVAFARMDDRSRVDCSTYDNSDSQDMYKRCQSIDLQILAKEAGVTCEECDAASTKIPETSWKDVAISAIPAAALLGSVFLTSKYQYKSQQAWADAMMQGNTECTNRISNFHQYSIDRGANNITSSEEQGLLGSCNGSSYNAYAGFGGLSGNGYGGSGNYILSGGYSPGFAGGMIGPGYGGANGSIYAGGNIGGGLGVGTSLALAALLGLGGGGLNASGSINVGGGYPNGSIYAGGGSGIPGVGAGGAMCYSYSCNAGVVGGAYPGIYGQVGVPNINGNINVGIPSIYAQGQIGVGTGAVYNPNIYAQGNVNGIYNPNIYAQGQIGVNTNGIYNPNIYAQGQVNVGPGGQYYPNINAQGNMNGNIYANPVYNAAYGLNAYGQANGSYYGNTGGQYGSGAYGVAGGNAAYYQQQMAMAQAYQGNSSAYMERSQGNALTAQVGGQALYQNYATASRDYNNYAGMYGYANIGAQF